MNTSYRCFPLLQGWCGRVTLDTPQKCVWVGEFSAMVQNLVSKRVSKNHPPSFSYVVFFIVFFCVLLLATIHVSCFFLGGGVSFIAFWTPRLAQTSEGWMLDSLGAFNISCFGCQWQEKRLRLEFPPQVFSTWWWKTCRVQGSKSSITFPETNSKSTWK